MTNLIDRKLNPRQMAFVGYIAAGQSEVEAYKLAGYAGEPHTLYGSASRLLTKPHIKLELDKQLEAGRRSSGLTLDRLVYELLENGRLARDLKQISASNQAYIAAGTALGIYVTKHESTSTQVNIEVVRVLEGMSTEELELAASRVTLALPEATVVTEGE